MRSLLLFIVYGLSIVAFVVITVIVCMAVTAFLRRFF
jgi:hypothetical protein